MQFKTLFLLFFAVSLIACSSTPEPLEEIQKGFSLLFPGQDEWTVVKKNSYKIVMTKPGLTNDERYMIQVLVVKLPKFKSDKGFLKFIKNRMKKSQKQSGVKVLKRHAQLVEGQNSKCVQYKSKEQYPGKFKPVILEVMNFTCRHPDREKAGVYFAYSKQYSRGNGNKDFAVNAADLFSYLELTAF